MQRRQFLRVSTLSVVALTTGGCALRRGFDSGLRIAVRTPWLAWPGQGQQVTVQASLWTEFVPSFVQPTTPPTRATNLRITPSSGVVLVQPPSQTQFQLAAKMPQEVAFTIFLQDTGAQRLRLWLEDRPGPTQLAALTLIRLDVGEDWTNVWQEDVIFGG